jgi:hypothetical protein
MVTPCRLASSSTTSRLETAPANLGGGDTAADLWIKKGTAGATALDATALDAEATAMADGQRSDQYITMVGIGGMNHRRRPDGLITKLEPLMKGNWRHPE